MSGGLCSVLITPDMIICVRIITASPLAPSAAPQPLDKKCQCTHCAVVLCKTSKKTLDPGQSSRTALSLLLLLAKMNLMFTMSQTLCKD